MKGSLKRTFILFLVCALTLTSGAFNAALACPQTITYSYEGDVPTGVLPPVPNTGYEANKQKLTLPPTPTVTGYTFLGWQCRDTWKEGGMAYSAGKVFEHVTDSRHYVGKWKLNTYKVTYHFVKGLAPTGAQVPVDNTAYTVLNLSSFTLLQPAAVTGYAFNGWTYNNKPVDAAKFKMKLENVDFYGTWTKEFKVIYKFTNTPAGTEGLLPDEEWHKPGTLVTLAGLGDIEGFTFGGWRDWIFGKPVTRFIMPLWDVVVKGTWVEKPTEPSDDPIYTVTYTFDITPDGADTPTDPGGHEKGVPFPLEDPLYDGDEYSFLGWKLVVGDGCPGAYIDEYTFEGEGDQSVTFMGFWQKNETPTPPEPKPVPFERQNVSYAYTGAVPPGAPATPELLWYLTPGTVKVMPVPQLEGYVFSGWSTQDAVVKDGIFLLSGKNVVFTGFWTAVGPATVGVPKTGDEQTFLLPGALALAGIALIVTALCRRDKKRGR